jgi:hypothetical protein
MKGNTQGILALAVALLFIAAGAASAEQGQGNTSRRLWTRGDSESPEMHPGRSCIDCHAKGEGPRFAIAGTVFQNISEDDDVYGVPGAVVQVTDAGGKVYTLTSNASGNFFLRARGNTVAMPFTAKVIYRGNVNAMATPQSSGNCAACHTAGGVNGAPGRIIVP